MDSPRTADQMPYQPPPPRLTKEQLTWERIHANLAKWNKEHGR